MKQFIILVSAILVSTMGFADLAPSNLTKQHSRLNELSAAWKTHQYAHPKGIQNDITIVYGGADISRKPTLASHITTA